MKTVLLDGKGDLAEWRAAARALLLEQVPPQAIEWRIRGDAQDLFVGAPPPPPAENATPPTAPAAPAVPRGFLELAETVICHNDPTRFGLLYRLLWRLQRERGLLDLAIDTDVIRAARMAKAVRRDIHKMTAFVRFKEIVSRVAPAPDADEQETPRRRFFAWFEPDHHIVARTAPFFQRRFNDMDWVIATPKGTAAWDGTQLIVDTAPADKIAMTDASEELWHTYFASIFNPARVKIKAMQKEMPKKYWQNMPETALIPGMIAGAAARVADMAARAPTEPPVFHARLQQRAQEAAPAVGAVPADARAGVESLMQLREAARVCTRCALHCNATQTVFGEGPATAEVMLVGEQPGDHEDLAGRPFVGPAGKLLDGVLAEVGVDRGRTYVTNAVKHFKYEPRGKRRIHQKPNMGEVQQCRWWLERELAAVEPKLVVALGATALGAILGKSTRLAEMRGRIVELSSERRLLTTVHPSYLLRLPDEVARLDETARFKQDLSVLGRWMTHPRTVA